MTPPIYTIQSKHVPTGVVTCLPIAVDLGEPIGGNVRIRLRMGARHFCTILPLNERVSHRLNLEWLVVSTRNGKVITVLSQSDHSYQYLEFFASLPDDRFVTLIPGNPYICDASPVIDVTVEPFIYGPHAHRYEVEVGASSDSRLIGDGWSYREGHLPFEHWFHNKAFRWGFDGALLSLPVIKGRPIHINLNALCRTTVEVWADGALLTTLLPISDARRWHDERYYFVVPEEFTKSDVLLIEFRFAQDALNLIDFNLRQSTFALSRVVVDIFGEPDSSLIDRVAKAAWSDQFDIPDFRRTLSGEWSEAAESGQVAVLVAEIEFEIAQSYFAPHSSLWNTVRGMMASAACGGISLSLLSSRRVVPEDFESIVLAPIRFDVREVERLGGLAAGVDGAVLAPTVPSLALFGMPMNDQLLNAFSYREIYDVRFPCGLKANFWEIMPTEHTKWDTSLLKAFDATVIGTRPGSGIVWLATASGEDWLEMGDPGAAVVLENFWKSVATPSIVSTDAGNCILKCTDNNIAIYAPEVRVAVRSYGGGIARGWANFEADFSLLDCLTLELNFNFDTLPRKGKLRKNLENIQPDLSQRKIVLGSKVTLMARD